MLETNKIITQKRKKSREILLWADSADENPSSLFIINAKYGIYCYKLAELKSIPNSTILKLF